MLKLRPIAFVLIIISTCTTFSQGLSVVTTLYSDDLQNIPGRITVSTDHITTVEAYDNIDYVWSGKQEAFTVELNGSRLILSTRERGGTTDLLLDIGGKMLMLDVTVDTNNDTSRRVIIKERATEVTQVSTNTAAPIVISTPAPPIVDASQVQSQFILESFSNNTAVVRFNLNNLSGTNLLLNTDNISIRQGEQTLAFTLDKQPLTNIVKSGDAYKQFGLITIENAQAGLVSIDWPATIVSPDGLNTVRMNQTFNLQ